ncbi:hypothetical protein GQ53DRAFT_504726 [Thozetella sp. PMI_491]|nr:hypothetical protein GQ53DRAFT_504726 [Thozetella sp. PMI_491]
MLGTYLSSRCVMVRAVAVTRPALDSSCPLVNRRGCTFRAGMPAASHGLLRTVLRCWVPNGSRLQSIAYNSKARPGSLPKRLNSSVFSPPPSQNFLIVPSATSLPAARERPSPPLSSFCPPKEGCVPPSPMQVAIPPPSFRPSPPSRFCSSAMMSPTS